MQIGESKGDKVGGKKSEGRLHTGDLFVLGRELRTDTPRDGDYYKVGAEKQTGKSVKTALGVEKPKGETDSAARCESEVRAFALALS